MKPAHTSLDFHISSLGIEKSSIWVDKTPNNLLFCRTKNRRVYLLIWHPRCRIWPHWKNIEPVHAQSLFSFRIADATFLNLNLHFRTFLFLKSECCFIPWQMCSTGVHPIQHCQGQRVHSKSLIVFLSTLGVADLVLCLAWLRARRFLCGPRVLHAHGKSLRGHFRFLIKSSPIFLRKKKGIRMDVFIDYQKQGPFRDLIRYFLKYFLSAFTMMRSSVHFKIGSNPCLIRL